MRLLCTLALIACAYASRSRFPSRTTLRQHLNQNGADCNFTSDTGNIGIQALGNSGQVMFYRRNSRGRIGRWLAVLPTYLREKNAAGSTVRRARGFADAGTSVTWVCQVANETGVDANGDPYEVPVLESSWTASREVFAGISGTTVVTQTVTLGFNVKLFTQPFVVDLCPRRHNATGFGRGAFRYNHTNCSAVEVPGVGLKWAISIQNWPYRDPANHLELRIKLRGPRAIGRPNTVRQAARRVRRRRQAARQIVTFGEGFLENPETNQFTCADPANDVADSPMNISIVQQRLTSAFMYFDYIFQPAPAPNCDIYYDPVMNDGTNTDTTTNDVGRVRVLGGLLLACVLVFFV